MTPVNPVQNPVNPVRRFLGLFRRRTKLASVTVQVNDTAGGWYETSSRSGASNERDASESTQAYADALTAWRKNPIAKRSVDITTDFCLGDGLTPTAPGTMGAWIHRFWTHPKNHMELRLAEFTDELARAGDLFVTLHRNPADGMSYVRAIPKDRISNIETLPNDWETELSYSESRGPGETYLWLSPSHPDAAAAEAVMLHYKVNSIVGATMGESDLATILPWLLRYSRMLEDRVRLNWALKMFMWIVTVPAAVVDKKREQYNTPPESGSVIVKDAQETWEAQTPNLHAFDAQYDMEAVRQFIDAGTGYPPHWRGEATDINLATATAMERAASRHLRRRQLYLRYIVIDLVHNAYTRAFELGKARARPDRDAILCPLTDLSRQDNRELAQAASSIAQALESLTRSVGSSDELRKQIVDLVFRFAAQPLDPEDLDALAKTLKPTADRIDRISQDKQDIS